MMMMTIDKPGGICTPLPGPGVTLIEAGGEDAILQITLP
jgi:hypothetical protein